MKKLMFCLLLISVAFGASADIPRKTGSPEAHRMVNRPFPDGDGQPTTSYELQGWPWSETCFMHAGEECCVRGWADFAEARCRKQPKR